ncbi:MAG: tyrosine--tRNA ligase [Planctomycetota bacterium]
MQNAFDTLKERGLVENVTDEAAARKMLAEPPVTFYVGFDPTADSLHVGHFIPIMAMAHLQRAGHRPIAVVGGGTGMIGDPSDRTELRQMLSPEQIGANVEAQKAQLRPFLDFDSGEPNAATMLNNAHWLADLNYIEFLRDIGVHFTVNRMLAAECFKQRWEKGLTFIEFNYMLLQAYDFLHLYRTEGCPLQVGGNDQWGNILAGTDLIRRVEGAEAHGMVVPLLLTSAGKKMGKTESGALWLSPEKTSPYDFYQYWRNVDDADVEKCFRMLTFLPLDEVRELASAEPGPALNESKKRLAFEVTKLVHGEDAANGAVAQSDALFGRGPATAGPISPIGPIGPTDAIGPATTTVSSQELKQDVGIIDALVELELCSSKSEARRLVEQGGAYVNDERVESIDRTLGPDDVPDGQILLRAGKKKHGRIVVSRGREGEH